MIGYSLFSNKSAIILDFDGTIADTSDIHADAFRRALQEHLICNFQYENYAGWRTEDVVRHVLKEAKSEADDQVVQRIVRLKQMYARSGYENHLDFMPGARTFIESAIAHDYRLALATGASNRNLSKAITCLGLEGKFEVIVAGDDVRNGKPDPETYLKALSRLDTSSPESIAIEDSCAGVQSAQRAGIDVVCINSNCNFHCMDMLKKVARATLRELTLYMKLRERHK